jgi:cytochrome c oxidase subunit IV
MARIAACWAMLVLLLVAELAAAHMGSSVVVCVVAILMVLVVVLGFMRILRAPPLAIIFALGGLFWLTILLALGSLDSFTRTTVLVHDAALHGPVAR